VGTLGQDPGEELIKLKRRLERERRARLESETIAEHGLRELYEKKRQLELLGEIAVAANESTSVDELLRFALGRVCQATDWPLGHAYVARDAGAKKRLVPSGIWYGSDGAGMEAFRLKTEATGFDPEVGLPGRVLSTGAPAVIPDVTKDGNFPRAEAARQSGIRSAFAFPVLTGTEVAAVLEFYSERLAVPDEFVLRLMAQIGTQLGRVVERKRLEDQLIHDASHDPLTKLPNRTLFLDRLGHAMAVNRRHPEVAFAVLFIDLDRFKIVNDNLGHRAGDELIVQVARRLLALLRPYDMVVRSPAVERPGYELLARLAGDEFTILLEDVRELSVAVRVAQRVLDALGSPFSIDGHEVHISGSIGIALSATGYTAPDEMVRDADLAMYRAKALGKARYEVYDGKMYSMAAGRLQVESDLHRALENEEFVLHYQPIVELSTGETVGFEALVRWQKPGSGLVYPDRFIRIAEDTGMILPLGVWVLREACRTMRGWHEEFARERPLTISVNLSARQFAQPDLAQQVRQIIEETGIDPGTVKLEITESVTMGNAQQTVSVLSELRELGVRFSIDDFGTGFSSLSYLHRFPFEMLKIDRSFVLRMGQDGDSGAIIRTIVNLARDLGMQVVAEGAETEAHVAQLKKLHCDFAQGYFFSRPVEAEAVRGLLAGERREVGLGRD
jgi:diguanylate cyclase (GGDEF)-like protein